MNRTLNLQKRLSGALAVALSLLLVVSAPTTALADTQTGSDANNASSAQANEPSLVCKVKIAGTSGWQKAESGKTCGRTSDSSAVTAVKVQLKGCAGSGISCQTYQTGKGWTSYVGNGKQSGTGKKANAIQAVRFKLTGDAAKTYTVWYRANITGYGWTDWGRNGQAIGARKLANVRAVQVKIAKKSAKAPGAIELRYFSKGKDSAELFYAKRGLTRAQLISAIGKAKGSGLKSFGCSYDFNSKAGKKLKAAIKNLSKHKLGFVMIDLKTGQGISYNPNKSFYSASTIKGPYVAAVNKYKTSRVTKSVRSTMSSTIKVSSNEGYSSLRRRFGHGAMKSMMGYSGVSTSEMAWSRNYTYMSARTLAKLWIGTYWSYYRETNARSSWARNLYAHPLNSFIDKALDTPTRSKPGWFPGGGYNVQNDAGVVLVDGHPYVVAVMSSACGQYGKLASLVKAIDAVHTDMIG